MAPPARKKSAKKNKRQENYLLKIVFISFLFAAIAAILFFYFSNRTKEKESFSNDKYTVRGVDLSHHNPIIEWGGDAKGRNNISFVYLKATGGIKHTDRNYLYNYKSAKDNNLKTGSYHFYLFGISGRQQARHFIKNAQFGTGDLYPAIDVEHSNDNKYTTDTAYIRLVVHELKELENSLYEHFGVHPVIYTNKECYKMYVKGNFLNNPIWMCNLKEEPNDADNWIIWQFSHKGSLEGVIGDIDLNYFRYPHNELTRIILP